MAVTIGAIALVALGLAGLVLPVLPGIVLLLAAVALLTREFQWARNLVDAIRGTARADEDAPGRESQTD